MASVRGAHLVGSLTYPDAESAMIAAAENLGGLLRRIPDGEPGDRFHWIMFQPDVLARAEGIERVGDEPFMIGHLDGRPLRIADGVDAADIRLPELGYARAAAESYEVFTRLRAEGVIAPGTRVQVALPTPTAVIGAFFTGEDRQAIEPVYRDLVYRELDGVLAAVPHHDLAIQWDCAVEFAVIETHAYPGGSTPWWPGDVWQGLVDRAADAIDRVPLDVEVGVHLCYGDVGERHFVEPRDAANLTRFANELTDATARPITWIHLPVPIERDDDAYFAPLEQLAIGDAELYLGLVHREDGVDGARRRIETAARHVEAFGAATECGIGRAPQDATEDIFRTHVAVAAPA
ncbi:hypothetical protein [Microbacterium lacticum]